MISIVICSINKDYLRNIRENIATTIGVPYELLIWDNSHENKGLCEVYNLMAVKAKYPFLCFMHEDIFFETQGWGTHLCDLFRDHPATGMIGIAGTSYKSAKYSGWYTGNSRYDFFNYTHRTNGVDHKVRQPVEGDAGFFPVVCIDGVLMTCRKEVWESVRFDAERLQGFHFYDIDFSLRASRIYGIGVTTGIDLIHITQGGDYGDRWVDAAMRYHAGAQDNLPWSLARAAGKPEGFGPELAVAAVWLNRLKSEPISRRLRWQWIRRQHLLTLPSLWYGIMRFLVYRPLGLARVRQSINRIKSSN